jgi:redox-sensitive bicupin YhaK (pirin superfamily)
MNTVTESPRISTPVSREVERLVKGVPTSDGAGVKLTRVLTHDLQRRLDPFLMMDVFYTDQADDYAAGFPNHPHRGFETVTYMLAGRMRHRDSTGGHGLLEAGGVQWMTAGRGVIHSEMPEQEDGLMRGFQLWLNLPAKDKMTAPGYRDLQPGDLTRFTTASGAEIKLIAGRLLDHVGPVERADTQPVIANVVLPAAGELFLDLPASHNAYVYLYEGSARLGASARDVPAGQMAILGNDTTASGLRIQTDGAARLLLVAGRPLNEPIAQYGPFVMNTREEIEQTLRDYQRGALAA